MDGSAFRHLNLDFTGMGWVFAFAAVGALALVGAAGFGLFWLISHLQWVG